MKLLSLVNEFVKNNKKLFTNEKVMNCTFSWTAIPRILTAIARLC